MRRPCIGTSPPAAWPPSITLTVGDDETVEGGIVDTSARLIYDEITNPPSKGKDYGNSG